MRPGSNDNQHHPSAFSRVILETLENILAPGGRARLSPYVEATQIQLLFNKPIDSQNRNRCIQEIVNQNQQKINDLAKKWVQFCQDGKKFSPDIYSDSDFLSAYLIYYFSVNVAKLQITLLDTLRAGELSDAHWHVVDVGVGSGTTIVAVADFLFTWKTVCDLHQAPFPVQGVRFWGLDKNNQALDFAQLTVLTFADNLKLSNQVTRKDFLKILIDSLNKSEWLEYDAGSGNGWPESIKPTLMVVSNMLNELDEQGSLQFAESISALPQGCTILALEPGDEIRSQSLMEWRRELIDSGHLSRWGFCGQSQLEITGCKACWNARRQSFHPTILYKNFRLAAIDFVKDKRDFDEFENNLLSWSTVWMVRGEPEDQTMPGDQVVINGRWPEEKPLLYIGRYTGNSKLHKKGPAGYAPDDNHSSENNGWKEYFKFCPGLLGSRGLTVIREPGYEFPNLHYGDKVRITESILDKELSDVYRIKLTRASQVKPFDESLEQPDSFLPEYSLESEKAVNEIAYRLFGFPSMKPFQHRILERVLTGRSILGIAATGSGKSECFILPAILFPGMTIVVSPLKSLMMDQYDQRICERYGLKNLVTYINGDVEFAERQARLRRMELGYYKLAYFTPEQLERGYILESLRRTYQNVGIRFLAMDEAHCISQWGHDFRPSYLNLSRRMDDCGIQPVRIALTATASPFVRQDICEELNLSPALIEDGGDVYVESSNRPELNLIVREKPLSEDKVNDILDELRRFLGENRKNKAPAAAIVFMPHTGGDPNNEWLTKGGPNAGRLSSGVTRFAAYLEKTLRTRVSIYHGKMDGDQDEGGAGSRDKKSPGDLSGRTRRGEQERFINGETSIMVATKGFGMGIDKDNIRLVIHRTPPSNLEAYAQEAGRAGRDGSQANVILYYSPDSASDETVFGTPAFVQSDYEIQEFFLREKYIRECDVMVMHAFLHTLPQRRKGTFYFTNDQAIEFFELCTNNPKLAGLRAAYAWPLMEKRKPLGFESVEHAEILERGHIYQQKTRYINRILQTLYRIRPTFEGQSRLAYLEIVQEAGAEIVGGIVKNGRAILNSNAYYGDLLRKAEVAVDELYELVRDGSVIKLSERLGLTIRETNDLLGDIKFSDGKFSNNKWQPALLDFQIIVAPKIRPAGGKDSLTDWLNYAGAYRRASKTEADRRAKQKKRPEKEVIDNKTRKIKKIQETVLEDWFSWREATSPTGWEVIPGPAFANQINFSKYLQVFMALHNQRQANDWASYHRLLSDYVGVNEDGSLKHTKSKAGCLRAVLLGYLETYEVVAGDSCYSCSRCVPDGRFDRYSLETRQSAVVRMSPGAIEQFDLLKEMVDVFPENQQVQTLFDLIEMDEQAGRSLKSYFSGWSARLLDQNSNHKAALWLRFYGMASEKISFQEHEFWTYAWQIFDNLPGSRFDEFEAILKQLDCEVNDKQNLFGLLARLYKCCGRPIDEATALRGLLAPELCKNLEQNILCDHASRLAELTCAGGPVENPDEFEQYTCLAARTSQSKDHQFKKYRQIVTTWDWDQVLKEMREQETFDRAEELNHLLCAAWVDVDYPNRKEQAVKWLLKKPEGVILWKEPLRSQILSEFPLSTIREADSLTELWLLATSDRYTALNVGLDALSRDVDLSKLTLEKLLADIEAYIIDEGALLSAYLAEAKINNKVIPRLINFLSGCDFDQANRWLNYLIKMEQIHVDLVKPLVLAVIEQAGKLENRVIEISSLQALIVPDFLYHEVRLKITASWEDAYQRKPELLCDMLVLLSAEELSEAYKLIGDLQEKIHLDEPWETIKSLFLQMPRDKWELLRSYVSKIQLFKDITIGSYLYHNHKITSQDLRALKNIFDWQKDPEEADKLAVLIEVLSRILNPNWKTPLVMLIEVLVAAGRKQAALDLYEKHPDLVIHDHGRIISVETYINRSRIPARDTPIPRSYYQIAEMMCHGRYYG